MRTGVIYKNMSIEIPKITLGEKQIELENLIRKEKEQGLSESEQQRKNEILQSQKKLEEAAGKLQIEESEKAQQSLQKDLTRPPKENKEELSKLMKELNIKPGEWLKKSRN